MIGTRSTLFNTVYAVQHARLCVFERYVGLGREDEELCLIAPQARTLYLHWGYSVTNSWPARLSTRLISPLNQLVYHMGNANVTSAYGQITHLPTDSSFELPIPHFQLIPFTACATRL